jgi:D-3-phosphoglycerate dehydrogenase
MTKILITTSSFGKLDDSPLKMLQAQDFEIILNPYGRALTVEESLELMQGVQGMIAGTEILNREVLSAGKKLKYLCRLGAGTDKVDFDAAADLNIKVENTPNAHVKPVAELTLAGMLSLARHVHLSDAAMKASEWNKQMGFLIFGKTIGLIGLGKVSKHLVKLLKPFEVKILAYDPYIDESFAAANNIQIVSEKDVYRNADIISLHVPYTPENHHLVNAGKLALMKENVMLLNASRGGLVDEQALFDFLQTHHLAKAYLDTFEEEPYHGPLLKLKNILCTPHIGSYAAEGRYEMEKDAAEKLIKHFNHG